MHLSPIRLMTFLYSFLSFLWAANALRFGCPSRSKSHCFYNRPYKINPVYSLRVSSPDCVYWPSGSLVDSPLLVDWLAMVLISLACQVHPWSPNSSPSKRNIWPDLCCNRWGPQSPVILAWLKSCLIGALRRLTSLFHQGTVLDDWTTLAGQFWW